MGGRGSSGGLGTSRSGTSPKLQNLVGSEKQIAWAEKIRDNAISDLESMKKNIDRLVRNGFRDDGRDAAQGYTKEDVQSVMASMIHGFNTQQYAKAGKIIDERSALTYDALRRNAQAAYSNGIKWDNKSKRWVKK